MKNRFGGGAGKGTNQVYSLYYSLDVSGTESQQLKTKSTLSNGTYFMAAKAYCLEYTRGYIGISFGNAQIKLAETSDGFVTIASDFFTHDKADTAYVGSVDSANLKGYLDDPVIISLDVFGDSRPTAEQMRQLYDNYADLERSREREDVEFSNDEKLAAFIEYMNAKALSIGMTNTHFNDSVGMDNLSTANDLLKLMVYANTYTDLTAVWENPSYKVDVGGENAGKQA